MSINLPTVLQDARHKLHDGGAWIWLLGLQVPTTPAVTRYRFANYTSDVTFDTSTGGTPLVWKRFPFTVGEFSFPSDGSLVSTSVTVSNVTREVGLALEQYNGLVGQDAELRLVYSSALANPAAQWKFEGKVTQAKVTAQAAAIVIGMRDLMRTQSPSMRYSKHRCGVQFGGTLCGYVIPASPGESVGTGFSTCPKTIAGCEERGDDEVARGFTRKHPEKWGGFAGLPRPKP